MTQNTTPIPHGAAGAVLKAVGVLFTNICPPLVKRHQRLSAEMDGAYEIAKQKSIEESLRNEDIAFPPGTSIEHMIQAFREDMLIALGKTQNRSAVIEEFCKHFDAEELEKLPPLREEVALPIFEYAGECTTKEAQERWARLIAGECRNPGSISLKTIHVLRTLDNADALLFEEYMPYVLDNILFIPNNEYFREHFYALADLGLVQEYKNVIVVTIPPNGTFISNIPRPCVLKNIFGKPIEITGHILTKVGAEIASLNDVQTNFDDIIPMFKVKMDDITLGTRKNNMAKVFERVDSTPEKCKRKRTTLYFPYP